RLVPCACMAVDLFVTKGYVLNIADGERLDFPFRPSVVCVTLRTRGGELRGCIGTLNPRHATVEEEVIDRAIASACHDLRFDPIKPGELRDLVYEVSVLHPPEDVAGEDELDPEVFGIIIRDENDRSGVMLPQVPTLDTVEKQIRATRLKVGIPLDAPIHIQRFKVDKFEED